MTSELFQTALPQVCTWVEKYVEKHESQRVPIADFGFSRLTDLFEPNWLKKTYCVVVDQIETPPLAEFGLGNLSLLPDADCAGITYGTTYFVLPGQEKDESLHFHELIHTVQWDQLGFKTFLKVYGMGLIEHGYRRSPMEVIAYDLQTRFDEGQVLSDIPRTVRLHTQELAYQLA